MWGVFKVPLECHGSVTGRVGERDGLMLSAVRLWYLHDLARSMGQVGLRGKLRSRRAIRSGID